MGREPKTVEATSSTSRPHLSHLTTPLLADACLRLRIPLRIAPIGIRPHVPGMKAWGNALPVQHFGSVDVFLEAFNSARGGEVLVIDNGGRTDEACIGDLTVLEATDALRSEGAGH